MRGIDKASGQLDDRKAFFAPMPSDIAASVKSTQPAISSAPHSGAILTRANDGLFYARAFVNDQPVRFIVDTGSSVVVLTPGDAKRLGFGTMARKTDATMQTAGGNVGIQAISLDRVRIGARSIRHVDAVIVRTGLATSL